MVPVGRRNDPIPAMSRYSRCCEKNPPAYGVNEYRYEQDLLWLHTWCEEHASESVKEDAKRVRETYG